MFEEVRDCPHLVQYYKCWQEDCASFAPPSLPAFMYILMECCARGSLTVLSLSPPLTSRPSSRASPPSPSPSSGSCSAPSSRWVPRFPFAPGARVSARPQRGPPRSEARQPPLRRAGPAARRRLRLRRARRRAQRLQRPPLYGAGRPRRPRHAAARPLLPRAHRLPAHVARRATCFGAAMDRVTQRERGRTQFAAFSEIPTIAGYSTRLNRMVRSVGVWEDMGGS